MGRRILSMLALVGLLFPLGCFEDGTWYDEATVVFQDQANSLVAVAIPAEEGNVYGTPSNPYVEDSVVVGEVYGSGEQLLEMVSETPSQRDSVLFIVWADDPSTGYVGEPDCDEDGTRLLPHLKDDEMTFVFPSEEYPLSWCGALMGPEGVEP